MSERYPLGIYSGALRPEIDWALGRIGVLDRFSAIISAEQTTRCKPDPQGYTMAYEALRDHPKLKLDDLDPGDCVVIEDSLAGLQAALGAGMCGVGVAQTYTIDGTPRSGRRCRGRRHQGLHPRVDRRHLPRLG